MVERKNIGVRLLPDGTGVITDPDFEMLDLIHDLDPTFTIRSAPLPGFMYPRFLHTREAGTDIAGDIVTAIADDELWRAHDTALIRHTSKQIGEASLLDIKVELATRILMRCDLCALRCGVDRSRGEHGQCGLGPEAFVYEAYTHIAEEPPINPALNISLRGCGMRCIFCQQFAALNPRGKTTEMLVPALWDHLNFAGARSLVFVGGNPTESLPAVLAFLRAAPSTFSLPLGWNCSGYDSLDAIRLLHGVCDVYVPDFKYGDDDCATRLAGSPGYVENAERVFERMLGQGVPVIARVVVLPGHVKCCHETVLDKLCRLSARGSLLVSIQGTYVPEWRAQRPQHPLSRRPNPEELTAVLAHARELGLALVD